MTVGVLRQQPNRLIDVSAPPKIDSGGAGGVSTAGDYLRFSQMLRLTRREIEKNFERI